MKRGYCAVTADILHPGHIRFINRCKKRCNHLTVGIMTDACVKEYKGHYPTMNQYMRMEIVKNLKSVDAVVYQHSFEFPPSGLTLIFDSIEHRRSGADIYLSYTKSISSSKIKECIKKGITLDNSR